MELVVERRFPARRARPPVCLPRLVLLDLEDWLLDRPRKSGQPALELPVRLHRWTIFKSNSETDWHTFRLALENGYMPENPRGAPDACVTFVAQQGVSMSVNSAPPYQAWMTGGAGAGTILATDQVSSWSAWPPASIGNTPVVNLPTYTATASPVTMSALTPTSFPSGYPATANVGDGWAQPTDTALWATPVAGKPSCRFRSMEKAADSGLSAGCSYLNPWSGNGAPIPTAPCTGGDAAAAAKKMKRHPVSPSVPTAPPSRRVR